MIYSIWKGEALTLVPGDSRPVFANGAPQDPADVMVHRFEAACWEDACKELDVYREIISRHPINGCLERGD